MKTAKIKSLYTAVALGLSTMAYQSVQAAEDYKRIGDLEIYQAAEGGSIAITMMLDISGSMESVDGICPSPVVDDKLGAITYHLKDADGKIINTIDAKDSSTGKAIDTSRGVKLINQGLRTNRGTLAYCPTPVTRIGKLKKAMLDLVSKEGVLSNDIKLGVGTFPTRHNWLTGQIAIPAKPLTREQRWKIMRYISTLTTTGSTPSAQAYVEAGAYMLGTTTAKLGAPQKRVLTVGSMQIVNNNSFKLLYCGSATEHGVAGVSTNAPANVSFGGSSLKWFFCNDGSNRTFPSFDFDMATQSGSWQATIIPNRLNKLDFDLLPEFDVVYGIGRSQTTGFDPVAMTNATAPRDPEKWKNRFKQFAEQYHFGQTFEFKTPSIFASGFPLSHASTKKPDGNTYEAVAKAGSECDGYGIYFLTDGQPNGGTNDVLASANISLNKTGNYVPTVDKRTFPDGQGGAEGYWNLIASYAKDLHNGNNPLKAKIKTATVGFGSVFTPANGIPTITKKIDGKDVEVADCDRLSSSATDGTTNDARNLCKLGERGYGYGEGGFLATSDPAAVSKSVVEFAESLNQTISASPAGTISIPSDPLNALTVQPYAYLPMMQPEVAKSPAVWQGNLRKYHTLYGTLYGRGNQRLYMADPNQATIGNERFPAHLNPKALDLWQTGNQDSGSVDIGGSRSHLTAADVDGEPNLATKTSRVVYIEGGLANAPTMVKVQVKNGRLDIPNINELTHRYTIEDLVYLADYLGFPVPKGGQYGGATLQNQLLELNRKIANTPMRATPVFGGVNHSVPVLASYRGEYDDDTGNISTSANRRTDYVLYGSMDGALHMTRADTGQEDFAFIPRAMFDNQRSALASDSDNGKVGQPYFGVDAPWVTRATYNYTDAGVSASSMMAYGGLRMGGKGFYALNIDDPAQPRLAFAISDKTTNFERLGQTWAKPTFTKIKTGSGANDFKEVVVFGGGYDMCYENPLFKLTNGTADPANTDAACNNKTQAEGNAIYMVDAKTGAFIARWQAAAGAGGVSATSDDRGEMKHSFVSEIVPLDRNNNGFVDSLYASDLGGQLFRIDLKEGVSGNDMTRRVVRVFNANTNLPSDMPLMRFYEKPSVSFYDQGGGKLAMVNIASGDRSSPLHKHRDASIKANRIYGIIDRDLTNFRVAQAGSGHLTTRNLTNNDLQEYNTADLNSMSATRRKELIDNLKNGTKQGWWYPMTLFETSTNVKHLKAIGSSFVTGNVFYTSIYSPDYQYTKGSACSARIVGATERQMFCLPWGICANPETGILLKESKNGTLGYSKGGPGIQEIAMSTITTTPDQSSSHRTIVGMQTLAERIEDQNKPQPAAGSNTNSALSSLVIDSSGKKQQPNGPSGVLAINANKILKVDRWYDLATAEANQ